MSRNSVHVKPGIRKYGTKTNYTQEQLEEALEKIRSGVMTRTGAAKHYNIPGVTLYYKLNAKHNKNFGRPVTFTPEEEEQLQNHLLSLSDMGLPLSMLDFRVIVRDYLNKSNRTISKFKHNMPGYEWGILFLQRHPVLKEKLSRKTSRKRIQVNRQQVERFFYNFTKKSNGVASKNLYSMDEIGFHDDPAEEKILFRRDCRHPDLLQNRTKSSFTVVFCGNAAGDLVPPFFIFKGINLRPEWLFRAPKESRMAVSRSGWIEATIFEDWLENQFIPFVNRDRGKKILMCSNLSAHISPRALRLCGDNNIAFICLNPNSNHLLQPLDIFYFPAVELAWRNILKKYRQGNGGKNPLVLPKSLFARLFKTALQSGNAASFENLKAGFSSCGLYPMSPKVVLNKLSSSTSIAKARETSVTYLENMGESHLITTTKGEKSQLPVIAKRNVSTKEVEMYCKDRGKTDKTKAGYEALPIQTENHGRAMGFKRQKRIKLRYHSPTFSDNESINSSLLDTVAIGVQESDRNESDLQALVGFSEDFNVTSDDYESKEAEKYDMYMSHVDEDAILLIVQERNQKTPILM